MKLYLRVFVASAAFAALASALPPSESVPAPRFAFTQSIEWPSSVPAAGEITRTITGDFDGDYRRDVVGLDSGEPVFLYAPTNWSVVHRIAVQATDIDTARGAGPQGRDSIALVGAAGLRRLDFAPALHTFTPVTISASTAWIGARTVRCADADANGVVDYAGVCADATSVVTLRNPGLTSVEAVFDTSAIVRDVRFVRWSGGTGRELAVLTVRALEIRTVAGTLLRRFPVADAQHDLIVGVTLADSPNENVGWLRSGAGPDEFEFVLANERGLRPQFALPSEIDDVYSIVAADASYGPPVDGDTDLLFCTTHDERPWLAQNLSDEPTTPIGGPYFDGTALAPLELSSSEPLASPVAPLASHAQPVWEDLDGDRRIDYLAWAGFANEFRFYAGVSSTIQTLHGAQLLRAAEFRHNPGLGLDEVLLKVAYGPLAAYLGSSLLTDFEIRVWRQPAIWSDLEAVATYALRVPEENDPAVAWEVNTSGVPEPFVIARIGLKHEETHADAEACFSTIYWFEFRTLAHDTTPGANPSVKAGPMYAAYLAASPADVVTLWQPCYSLLLPLLGLDECPAFPPYWFYSTPNCASGSQEPAPGPAFGTRRRVIPISETLPIVPAPAPVDPNPLYSAWWLEPI